MQTGRTNDAVFGRLRSYLKRSTRLAHSSDTAKVRQREGWGGWFFLWHPMWNSARQSPFACRGVNSKCIAVRGSRRRRRSEGKNWPGLHWGQWGETRDRDGLLMEGGGVLEGFSRSCEFTSMWDSLSFCAHDG